MNRRTMFALAAGGAVTALSARAWSGFPSDDAEFEITFTEQEWKQKLSAEQFAVLRGSATERPYTSELLDEKRAGIFHCGGCDLPLYETSTKFDSGTGWPSFWQPLPDSVLTQADYILLFPRTELICRRCGGHLGHRFDDGPKPTGLRDCINGIALTFRPADVL